MTTATIDRRSDDAANAPTQRLSVEIHLNANTLEARHCLTTVQCFRYHDGYTEADAEAGWQQITAFSATGVSEAEIEARKAEAINFSRTFWCELLEKQQGNSIIANGRHYVAAEVGVGAGFYGEAFRVEWHDASRPAFVCNLSTQGQIPGWLRSQCPDNATIMNLDYLLDERPVISRRRAKRLLMAAGLRPSEANAFVRKNAEYRHYIRQAHYWPSSGLREQMKHGKRHAERWFPWDIYID